MENIEEKIAAFQALAKQIMNNIVAMADIYKSVVDMDDAVVLEKFVNANPAIPMPVWDTLLKIAEKRIYYGILWTKFSTNPVLRSAAIETQKELVEKGAELLLTNGDYLRVKLDNMTVEQFEQIVTRSGYIRTLPEQRAWLANNEKKDAFRTGSKTLVIDGRRLFVTKPTIIGIGKLKSIIEEMER